MTTSPGLHEYHPVYLHGLWSFRFLEWDIGKVFWELKWSLINDRGDLIYYGGCGK